MKKILIATRNKDKFKIVSKLLGTKNFYDFEFYSLEDIEEVIVDKKEEYDITNRSLQKALNVYDNLNKNIYDYIVGIDDGIILKEKIIANVKDYIKPIIDNKYLSENEIVYIIRAYTFINKDGKQKSIITKIPFKYKKLEKNFKIEANSYPLSYVLTPINYSKVVAEQSDEEANDYYLKYSKNKLDEVEKFFYKWFTYDE